MDRRSGTKWKYLCFIVFYSNRIAGGFAAQRRKIGVETGGGRAVADGLTEVTIYTDGACSGNPGPGGYGVLLISGTNRKELSGGEAETTNNRMELTAVIVGLEALKRRCAVTLYSDSKYVVDMVEQGWMKRWRANGWKRSKTEAAKNPDLLERLWTLLQRHEVRFVWVKGHASNPMNNRCDELAVAASRSAAKK